MDITYFALEPVLVGEDIRLPGQLVPEAKDWAYLFTYIQTGKVAPVLVVTLPKAMQDMLVKWEADADAAAAAYDKAVATAKAEAAALADTEAVEAAANDQKVSI